MKSMWYTLNCHRPQKSHVEVLLVKFSRNISSEIVPGLPITHCQYVLRKGPGLFEVFQKTGQDPSEERL